jgi:hypothetical protein
VFPGGGAFVAICLIYIVVVPICGIIYFSILCCGGYCGKAKQMQFEQKSDRMTKIILLVSLGVLLLLLL